MIRAVLVALALAGPAEAESTAAAAAEAAARRIETASALLDAADSRDDRIAALTETVRAFEDGLVALRDGLRQAAIRQAAIEADLAARSDEVAALLGVLESIGRAPAPILSLHPSGPLGTARAGMILADVTPALQGQVDALRAQLQELSDLRTVQAGAAATLQRGLDLAQQARAELAEAVANRTDLPRRFTENPEAVAALIAGTETLDAFAGGLDATEGEELAVILPDALDLKGALALPVAGTILRRAGEADAAGVVRPGWVIATRPRALVTTPVTATLRYRGPLLDYGNVVILEPAPDVLFVLAGLAEVFGETGQILPAGSPVGLMGGTMPGADAILGDPTGQTGTAQSETLYLEVREGQSPADPASWFAAN